MILGISGRKQAGKNTVANILHGVILKDRELIKDCKNSKDRTNLYKEYLKK